MFENPSINLKLTDGSSIAVIGGGPAGSFFSYFAFDFAQRIDLNIAIDIYEAKDFCAMGPAGCNHCGGIISESLVQMLSTDGIVLPGNIIRRGINTYTLHLEQGLGEIHTPNFEKRIASVFRGSGPQGNTDTTQKSFDNYLLELCKKEGANIIYERVTGLKRAEDGIIVQSKKSGDKKYDLVVGAGGLNNKTIEMFASVCSGYTSPKVARTYICEFYLQSNLVEEYFGNSMHVFLLNLPNITFGALIPKGNYVTLVLLGKEIDKSIAEQFISAQQVKDCFPGDIKLIESSPCRCFPYINVNAAKNPFDNRVVLIGDAASSKLYKNGIGAAYLTGRAAANTVIFEGISENVFRKYYYPVCRHLNQDNMAGKFIFFATRIIQKSDILKNGLLSFVINEQKKDLSKRRMSSILWDTFTGSAGYRNILARFFHPAVLFGFFRNILTANLNPKKNLTKWKMINSEPFTRMAK